MQVAAYVQRVLEDSTMTFVFVGIFVLGFFGVVACPDIRQRFIALCFVLVVGAYYYQYTMNHKVGAERKTLGDFVSNENTLQHIEFVLPHIPSLHASPDDFTYLKNHAKIMVVVNDLSFLKHYDAANFTMVVCLLEYFLRTYYNILSEEHKCKQFFDTLCDIRRELLNRLTQFHINVPTHSGYIGGNANEKIDKCTKRIQAITHRYIKIAAHKCKRDYKGPRPLDTLTMSSRELY